MRARLFLFAAVCLLLTACPAALHGVGGGTGSTTPAMTPQAVMVDRACGATPWDKTPSINPQGWADKPPTGMVEQRCGGTTWGPYYCADGKQCTLTYKVQPPVGMAATDVHFVVDLGSSKGEISVCAEYDGAFGVGSLNCNPVVYKATDMPQRIIVQIQPRGVMQERAMVIIKSVSGSPTILKVATAEAMRL